MSQSKIEVDKTQFLERNVSHHFEHADQEFDSCKMGMWLFLLTEILLFGGLFVAYVVFRSWHPETWEASVVKGETVERELEQFRLAQGKQEPHEHMHFYIQTTVLDHSQETACCTLRFSSKQLTR